MKSAKREICQKIKPSFYNLCVQSGAHHMRDERPTHIQLINRSSYSCLLPGGNRLNIIIPSYIIDNLLVNSLQFSSFLNDHFEIFECVHLSQWSSGGPRDRQVEPHTNGQRYCLWARPHDDHGDGVAQDGGQTPANRLTKTYSLGLQRPFLILDIYVMVN